MGSKQAGEIDAWLRRGGDVVTASERGARAVIAAYHRARRAEGLTAWAAPDVRDWHSFAQREWSKRKLDARMILNLLQEQSLWAGIVKDANGAAAGLEAPMQRLAAMAMEAHRLICVYAPQNLEPRTRGTWQQDAGEFSDWLTAFDQLCRRRECASATRLPLELIALLETDATNRGELLLVGFDRILPSQLALLRAWGSWREAEPDESAQSVSFFRANDTREELTACALWCRRELDANPKAKLLVVTQNEAKQRGEIERAMLRHAGPAAGFRTNASFFEFSLGVPLAQTSLGRGALTALKWLSGPIAENEIDWLLSTGQLAANDDESRALTAHMREIRRRILQRPEWTLSEWMSQCGAVLPDAWTRRVIEAKRQLEEQIRQVRSPLKWAELTQKLLETAGWPGGRPLGSEEFQVTNRLGRILDDCASLGFDGAPISWPGFVSALERASSQSLFAPESQDAPILISGPAETAGLAVDGIWFLGASDDDWPASGATHPFLPIAVQREARMPHATAQFDWELAQAMTTRLMASAKQVNFSYARLGDDVEARPSRLIAKLAGEPCHLPDKLKPATSSSTATEPWSDGSLVPFPGGKVHGGASVLTAQSQCPFKAFATARLGAKGWDAAEAGLTPQQRGLLLHAVLKLVWDPAEGGINSHAQLMAITDLRGFVDPFVPKAMADLRQRCGWDWMPARYLELERIRLTTLVTEWLEYEKARVPFTVGATEAKRETHIEGLNLRLRIDRIDRLSDGKLLVIDYKTGDVDPKEWELPRPNDVQLPLYASFALNRDAECGGLVFAKVRTGEFEFAGCVEDAKGTLRPKTSGNSNLVKKPLTPGQLRDWKEYIEKCATAFVSGQADINPRDYPDTCKGCGLHTICRIEELRAQMDGETRHSEGGDE